MRSFTRFTFSLALALASMASLAIAQTPSWSSIGITPNPAYAGRWSPACLTIPTPSGARVFFGGGYVNGSNAIDFWEYNTSDKKWTQKKDIPGSDRTGGVFFSINGKGYIGLGAKDFNSISASPTPLKDLYEYDPVANTWTKKADLPDTGRYECMVVVMNNKAYIIGGNTGNWTSTGGYVATSDVWEYNPATDKWTSKKSYPPGAITEAMTFSIGNKGYLACGNLLTSGAFAETKSLYEYNPTSDTWTKKADFPSSERCGGIGFAIGPTAYVGLGQKSFSSFFQDIYTYNPTTDKWGTTAIQFPAAARSYAGAAVISNKAYIGAGWALAGTSQKYYNDWNELSISGVGVTSIANPEHALSLYPNPCRDDLHIEVSGAQSGATFTYAIYDMVGRRSLVGLLRNGATIDTRLLLPGKYTIEVDVNHTPTKATIDVLER